MKEIVQEQFEYSLDFSNKLVEVINSNFLTLLHFLPKFKVVYDREEKKLPYHINLIDELRANENAHSRILEKLLQQQEPTNKKYEILESFLQFILDKYCDKQEFQKIEIKKPQITQEKKRIDLWIRDQKNYAIVIENKVHNAVDQNDGKIVKGGQLERYIDITKEHNFKEEQIYVLYLPPTYEKEPSRDSWGEKYFEGEIHKKRYLNLSFRDDILPWMKNRVLPNIRLKDKYLSSTIEQYIDHLEGKFSLRTINNSMNMELQEFIKKELGLIGIEPEKALKIILNKKVEMQNAINQLNELEKKINTEHFQKWENLLKTEFSNYNIVGNWNKPDSCINIGIKVSYVDIIYSLMIQYNIINNRIYYGIGRHYATQKINRELNFEVIISDLQLQLPDEWWYAWDYTSFHNAYMRLKTLIEKIELQNLQNKICETTEQTIKGGLGISEF